MAAVSATADVRSVHAHGTDGPDSSQNHFETVVGVFTAQDASTGEPSLKKRKLENGHTARTDPAVELDEDKSIVLAKISVDLRFCATASNGNAEDSLSSSKDQKSFPVSLETFTRKSSHGFSLSMWNYHVAARGIELHATATDSSSLDSISAHLDTAILLRTTVNGRRRSSRPSAAFCRSILVASTRGFSLEVEVRWLVGFSVVESLGPKSTYGKPNLALLAKYFPSGNGQVKEPWSLADFYDSVHVPSPLEAVAPQIEKDILDSRLYPFQQRAVQWLLEREGVTYPSPGSTLCVKEEPANSAPVSFKRFQDAMGNICYVSHLRGMIVKDLNILNDPTRSLRGGILSEEMGLGKTVELVALICHHQRPSIEGDGYDPYTGATVKPSGATLVITPPSILEQWKTEIVTHAPTLKVTHYKGLPSQSAPKEEHRDATVENLLKFDIVLTTYNVLSREVHFAKPPPDRSLRHKKQHQPRKSPLMQISWWRVCLDEAQMVESGVSQAATVARIIPRCNAWAVSGTPLRKDIQDLRGLLTFLRYEPFASCKPVWDRLDKPSFRSIFTHIALRHTKDKVRDELRLPPQKRIVITIPFTAIEEQNYSELIRQMCDACGLSSEGLPLEGDRDINHPEVIERMREWLVRLRQTCLHAHVGRRNRRALGARNGPLRTVHEVLEVMIEQNDTSLKAEAREWILALIRSGHLQANARDNEKRSEIALTVYKEALQDAQDYVKTCREELEAETKRVRATLPGTSVLREHENEDNSDDEERGADSLGRIPTIRKVLRSFLELEHACDFFIGTSYFQIKSNESLTKPESEEFHALERLEVEWYDKAKAIRRELLRDSQDRAQRQMRRIKAKQEFCQLNEIPDLPDRGGIENRKNLTMMDDVIDLLNAQAKQLGEWRQKVIDILLLPLVDEDEGKDTTGEEYEDSTKVQDELYVYIMALRTIIADRGATVNGLHDVLVDHELREAEKAARDKEGPKGHAPELVLQIVETRRKLKPAAETGSLKGVVAGIRQLLNSLQWRADGGDTRALNELAIVQKQFSEVQKIATEQTKILAELEKEQEMFRAAMNQRLEFYRQLQHISDTVAPWKEELDPTLDQREYNQQQQKRKNSARKLGQLKTKAGYLANLRHETEQDAAHECIICQDEFEIGVLTSCGHKYCKFCINRWWHEHRNCPLCKVRLHASDFKDINFKPGEVKAKEESHEDGSHSQSSTPSSPETPIYSDISGSVLKEIKAIDLDGSSYGTKVDMIARHLLWIRANDPGAKSIIFSQFGDFLEVLREALKKWKIGCSAMRDKTGIEEFRIDPAVECFLLDAKSDSSGLNLVNATYVFLCEPLINPAIELQAIARVHRIGQQRPTTVFMYLVSDTVEEAIYDISVSRRLEHMGRRGTAGGSRSGTATPGLQEKTLDAANSMEMEAAPLKQLLRKKGDGEIVQADDLWSCLFGRPRRHQRAVLDQEVERHLRAEAAEERLAQAAADMRVCT